LPPTAIHSARQTCFRHAGESAYIRRMSRKHPFRVGRSRTGLGLFATAPINKRARIAEYKGRRLANPEAERLEARGNRYLYELNSRWTIDGTTRRNIARYANHSCRPNAESYQVGHRVFLRAIKNIKPGDEITYDYGTDYYRNVITPSGCKCVKCREKRNAAARARRLAKVRAAKRLAKARAAKRLAKARSAKRLERARAKRLEQARAAKQSAKAQAVTRRDSRDGRPMAEETQMRRAA
jgi:SET domain-containing protein